MGSMSQTFSLFFLKMMEKRLWMPGVLKWLELIEDLLVKEPLLLSLLDPLLLLPVVIMMIILRV
ncbi:hypothetical protein Csa_023541, partial [Cucumis sativus]